VFSKQGACPLLERRSTTGGGRLSQIHANVFQSRRREMGLLEGARLFDNGSVFGVRREAQRRTAFLCSVSRLSGRSIKRGDTFEDSPD